MKRIEDAKLLGGITDEDIDLLQNIYGPLDRLTATFAVQMLILIKLNRLDQALKEVTKRNTDELE